MSTYAQAGVDIEAGDRAVELMRASVARATRPEVVGGIGGFAGLFDASALARYRRPLLATATDGVGTKVAVAQRADRHDTIGIDLVAMVLDDLVVCGAEPLFMTDYIACGRVVPERVGGDRRRASPRAAGCAGAALVGGETAEHPGLLGPDEYDVAGAGTGVVEADDAAGPGPGAARRRRRGDGVVRAALQRLLAGAARLSSTGPAGTSDRDVPELGRTLGDELLEPTTRLRAGLPGARPRPRPAACTRWPT